VAERSAVVSQLLLPALPQVLRPRDELPQAAHQILEQQASAVERRRELLQVELRAWRLTLRERQSRRDAR
jgi:hypothetical protein